MFLESMKQKNGKYKSGRHGSIKELYLPSFFSHHLCLLGYTVNQQGDYIDKNIRIAQYLDQRMVSPVEENFMTINRVTYATGKDGQGLYRLIQEEQARFFNEAVPINEKFRLKKCLTEEEKKEAVVKELQRMKDKE